MSEEMVLERATDAWLRCRTPGEMEPHLADCRVLAETGLFSNRHLEAITGLPEQQVARITGKTDKTGGRLTMHTLPLLLRVRADYAAGIRNDRLVRLVVEQGTSARMVAKLTGIPFKVVYRVAA